MATATDPLAGAVGVAAQLRAIEAAVLALGPELVPERIAKQDLGPVVRSLGRIERCAAGARLVLTKAAADVGAWKAQGFRSPAEWAARANGTTVGQAQADLEASSQLERLPATRDAVGAGELSSDAAKAVAAGASADRSMEQGLLEKGRAGDLTGARNDARKARQRADDRDGEAAERMHRRRQLRTWVEVDGEGRGQWNVPPAYQATFLAALEPYRREAFRQSRAAGQVASAEALMADALQLLCLDVLADLDLPVPESARTAPGPRGGDVGDHPTADDGPSRGTAPDGPRPSAAGPSEASPEGAAPDSAPASPAERGSATDPRRSPGGVPGDASCGVGPSGVSEPASAPVGPGADVRPADGSGPSPTLFGLDGHVAPPRGVEPERPAARPAPPSASGRGRASASPKRHRRAPAQIHFHVDVAAWLRGRTEGEEICEVAGLGPVPVSLARAFEGDATLKLVVRDGDDITTITSHRRYIPAALRTALEARDRECVVPGCHVTRGLQVDHIHDFAEDGPTEAANNCLICVFHHYLKTHCHWVLRGPPGHWTFTPPDTG